MPLKPIEIAYRHYLAGNYREAETLYRQILDENPSDYNAAHQLGVLALHSGTYQSAYDLISKAVQIVDKDPSSFNNLGQALRGLGRFVEAERCFRKAIELDPRYSIGYSNLGATLNSMGRHVEAENACRAAIALTPSYAEAYNHLGATLCEQDRFIEAEEAYRTALRIMPDYVDTYNNFGVMYKNLGRYGEARKAFRKALSIDPENREVRFNISIFELLKGNLIKGFELFENRFDYDEVYTYLNPSYRRWSGESLKGKKILLLAEQGAGDTIMMLRYIGSVKRRKPDRIAVYCDENTRRIVEATPGIDVTVPMSEPPPFELYDFFCPLMSLPYIFRTNLRSIPNHVPYIYIPQNKSENWHERMDRLQGTRVGLAWAGNRALAADKRRSMDLNLFKPLFSLPGVHFISLQKGEASGQIEAMGVEIFDWMDDCVDFLDTARLIAQLDLVISVDTAVAHLAGAMGKPVWLLNRFESEWRWMLDRQDSPWYPTMRIFRQKERNDWCTVIECVVDKLHKSITDNVFMKKE